jgi:DNA-binding MarR family transcriptional regulator
MPSKPTAVASDQLPEMLKDAILGLVRREGADLSARQLAILLMTYLEKPQTQTVRGLAARLDIAKPAVTRSLDRLVQFDLVRRLADPTDRRSMLIGRTRAGDTYMAKLRALLADAAQRKAGLAPVAMLRTRARR